MGRFVFFVLNSVCAGLVVWLGGFIVYHTDIRNIAPDNTLEPADAVVALTGGRNRIAEAVRLYNKGLGKVLIISGVAPHVSLEDLEKQNNTVVKRADGQVILGSEATNTIENAIEVSEIIRRRGILSVRLVTSYYHMPRSKQEILAHNPDLKIIMHPVYSENVSSKWWRRPKSFYLIASEYNKFMFVYLKNTFIKIFERD